MIEVLCQLVLLYEVAILGRIILSWFPIEPGSGLAQIYGFLYSITEPVLGPIRRIIPPVGAGGMGIDLSPLIVFFGITILQSAIC